MFLPLDMCPARWIIPQRLEDERECDFCTNRFVSKDGVIHLMHFMSGGEERGKYFFACTIECVIQNTTCDGRA